MADGQDCTSPNEPGPSWDPLNDENSKKASLSSRRKWGSNFKMLMLLPNSITGSAKYKYPNSRNPNIEGDMLRVPNRKRSNSAISLFFNKTGLSPTSETSPNLSTLQQPYSTLLTTRQFSNGSSTTLDSGEIVHDADHRRSSSPQSLPLRPNRPVGATHTRPKSHIERQYSQDESTRLAAIETNIVNLKNSLVTLKKKLNDADNYLRSQLERDTNTYLLALHKILYYCPEIANSSDIHSMATQLMRYVSSPSQSSFGESSSSGIPSSSDSKLPEKPPLAVVSGVVVSPQLKSDIIRCVDSLAVLLVRRLSRQISASILSELKDHIVGEDVKHLLSLDQPSQTSESVSLKSAGDGFRGNKDSSAILASESPPNDSRLALSLTDVNSVIPNQPAMANEATSPTSPTENIMQNSSVSLSGRATASGGHDALSAVPSLSTSTPSEDLDLIVGRLCRADGSIEALIEQLRLADRYLKDIALYVEKRTTFYVDYVKALNKLANTIKPSLSSTSMSSIVPLQYLFLPFVQHDLEYTSLALRNCQVQLTERDGFVSIVTERRTELKRAEKSINDKWSRGVNLYVSAMGDMRKAHQAYERAMEILVKRRDEECLQKEADAQIQLRTKIMEVNHKLNQLEKTKSDCLYEIIRQIGITESILKECSEKYFQFISVIICEHPSVYEAMRSQSRCIEVGSQFMAEVRRIISENNQFFFEPIEFEQLRKSLKTTADPSPGTAALASSITSMIPMPRTFRVPLTVITSFDSDDESQSRSSSPTVAEDSFDTSGPPTVTSQRRRNKRHESLNSGHSLSKLRTSSAQCVLCRSATVYENGVKCDKCGLVFHRKCVETIATVCDSRRRVPIFGVDLACHLADTAQPVPLVLQRCTAILERDSLSVKGIYRVPGSKKQIESVCRALEEDSENSVNLDDEQPHVLTGIVKSYLLQLPEPLFTNKLAACAVKASQEDKLTVEELQVIVRRLPEANYLTCGHILQHLKVVATKSEENQMTVSNLAIIFGPTLLLSMLRNKRQSSSNDPGEMWSMSTMSDTVHAAKVVEKLLANYDVVFDNIQLFMSDLRQSIMNGGKSNVKLLKARSLSEDPINTNTTVALLAETQAIATVQVVSRQTSSPNSSAPLAESEASNQPQQRSSLGSAIQSSTPCSSTPSSKQSSPSPSATTSASGNTDTTATSTSLPSIVAFKPIQQAEGPAAQRQPQASTSNTDTSIQSASVGPSASVGKKPSSVIVRL